VKVTLAKIARRSSWKREVEVHQLAGNVILRLIYPFDSVVGREEASSARDMFKELKYLEILFEREFETLYMTS
jgi:hypothetical protein